MDRRAKVERIFICNELHNRVCSSWLKFMLHPTILSVSVTRINRDGVCLDPLQGALTVFWLCYDGVLATRDCEEILTRIPLGLVPSYRQANGTFV